MKKIKFNYESETLTGGIGISEERNLEMLKFTSDLSVDYKKDRIGKVEMAEKLYNNFSKQELLFLATGYICLSMEMFEIAMEKKETKITPNFTDLGLGNKSNNFKEKDDGRE
jgi:hypothetical protein